MEQGWSREMGQGWGRDGAGMEQKDGAGMEQGDGAGMEQRDGAGMRQGWGRRDGPWLVTDEGQETQRGGQCHPSLLILWHIMVRVHLIASPGGEEGFFPHAGLVGCCRGKGFLCLQRTM